MMILKVKFSATDQHLPVKFKDQNDSFRVGFRFLQTATEYIEHDIYDGAYDVTPLITSQVLQTNQKLMTDDVRIDMIPTREISNASGGVTFIVG